MSHTTEPLTFTVPLSFKARAIAEKYHRQQVLPQKAKQVYLNTLAVYAVDFYLQCLGLETDIEQSNSHNPIAIKFMDVADLAVKQLGKLECRPVLADEQVCRIPLEVHSDRIGYVAVEIDRSLKQATLLGFTPTATAEVPLRQLRSLAEFPEYLSTIGQTAISHNQKITNLRKWFEAIFEADWLPTEAIFASDCTHLAAVRNTFESQETSIKRAKLLDLGVQLGDRSVILAIALTQINERQISVLAQLYPTEVTYLPPNLQLTMLSESEELLQSVPSRSQDDYIQLKRFKGEMGDRFKIRVSLDNISVTEEFVL